MFNKRLKLFLNPFLDGRYEDLQKGRWQLNVLRDLTAGLIVAMVAIPLAMGFAMASGLRPEQGIVGGAIAGLIGALFGGSKYQVYGPTAAFIPVIAAIMLAYDHSFLVLCALGAGGILCVMGLAGFGKYVNKVPHSIVVGFTIGIAVTIALSQVGEVFGFQHPLGYKLTDKIRGIGAQFGTLNIWAVVFAVGTLVLVRTLLKWSVFIPAPLIALGLGMVLSSTVLSDVGLTVIRTKYGEIPAKSWTFTPPSLSHLSPALIGDLVYYSMAIVFVCAIESLLCSRMADRLANNQGTKFHPDKELWGQGLVNIFVVLFNGFPHTGALARTATNIKLGALSPLSGIAKFGFKLALAFYMARYLELVPMACIGGILMFVAMNMVKRSEVDEVFSMGRNHTILMVYTAVAVIATDFLTGVITALGIYLLWRPKDEHAAKAEHKAKAHGHAPAAAHAPSNLPARAELGGERALARKAEHDRGSPAERRAWLSHIRQRAHMPRTSFVHHQANVAGRVVMGDHVHIAAGTSVRADEGAPFFIGSNSNVQDGVIVHALKEKFVRVGGEEWAVYVGKNVSMAHGALVHGPCYIGDNTFIGFKAVVHDSVVGANCFIGIGAVVVGVEVPDGKFVPHGSIIDSAEKVDGLPDATHAHHEFNDDVVEVNRGLAAAYREHRDGPPKHLAPASDPGSSWMMNDRF